MVKNHFRLYLMDSLRNCLITKRMQQTNQMPMIIMLSTLVAAQIQSAYFFDID